MRADQFKCGLSNGCHAYLIMGSGHEGAKRGNKWFFTTLIKAYTHTNHILFSNKTFNKACRVLSSKNIGKRRIAHVSIKADNRVISMAKGGKCLAICFAGRDLVAKGVDGQRASIAFFSFFLIVLPVRHSLGEGGSPSKDRVVSIFHSPRKIFC